MNDHVWTDLSFNQRLLHVCLIFMQTVNLKLPVHPKNNNNKKSIEALRKQIWLVFKWLIFLSIQFNSSRILIKALLALFRELNKKNEGEMSFWFNVMTQIAQRSSL